MVKAVYFIANKFGKGPIKIGISRDPAARLTALQTSSPNELMLIGVMAGGSEKERELHIRFKEFRMRGEWFRPEESLIKYIYANGEPYDLEFSRRIHGAK